MGVMLYIIVGSILFWVAIEWAKMSEEREKRKQQEKELNENIKIWSSGNWNFPFEKFYKKCISEFPEVDFSKPISCEVLKKVSNIADSIMEENGVFRGYRDLYVNDEKIKEYLQRLGETSVQYKEKLKKKIKLEDELDEVTKLINEKNEAQDAMIRMSKYVANSAYKEPEHDWAIIGGITQGLAGPGAGMAAAHEAMEKNRKIRERNEVNQKFAISEGSKILSTALSMSNEISDLEEKAKELQRKIDELN